MDKLTDGHTETFIIGTCESEIFVQIESRIESAATNFESNQDVVVYMFNANCHRSFVGLLRTTGNRELLPKQYYTIAPTVLASVYALAT